MKPTSNTANPVSFTKPGFSATLLGLLNAKGSGAPAPSRALAVLASLCVSVAAFLCVSAPALAASIEPGSVSVTEVTSESAQLNAVIDPEGAATQYVFEYGPEKYEGPTAPAGSVAVGQGETGAGEAPVPVEVTVQGLTADTTYHLRALAAGVAGEEASFTTQTAGGEFALPDDRLWEKVTPQNKLGAQIEAFPYGGGDIQAAVDGGALAYVTSAPMGEDIEGSDALEVQQMVATRGPDGWSTRDIASPHNEVSEISVGNNSEYKLFSPELTVGLLEPKGETPLPPLEAGAQKTIYLRQNAKCGAGSAECYVPLVTKANTLPGSRWAYPAEKAIEDLHPVGASPDLTHVVFESPAKLTEGTVESLQLNTNLYEWNQAEPGLKLVSVLPGPAHESVASAGASYNGTSEALLGFHSFVVRNAVSANGARVVWEAGGPSGHHLYLRDMALGETVQLDALAGGSGSNGEEDFGPKFEGANSVESANSDGSTISKIFFLDDERLTPDSHASEEQPDLYVYEVNESDPTGSLQGTVHDLTSETASGEPANVLGIVSGISEEGTYVYFVADGVLAPGTEAHEAECRQGHKAAGSCSLYVAHEENKVWSTRFIATLTNEDRPDWSGQADYNSTNELQKVTARVSPNGLWFAFMSNSSLTGYDNTDVASGVSDEEVFTYSAASGKLTCASCDPTGARPHGVYDPNREHAALLVDQPKVWSERWLSGNVPGWTPADVPHALYQSRYLSNEGRLFFDSADPLVPSAVNPGVEDVYEYEPEGVGPEGAKCGPESVSGSEAYKREGVPGNEAAGCVSLLSGGTSSRESAFLDATESGNEAFFTTSSQLSPQDLDNAYDVYDARECGPGAGCALAESTVPPGCTSAESCRAAPTPQPAIFGSPASATFSGAGNAGGRESDQPVVKKVTKKTVKCKKGFTKKKNKCVKNKKSKRAKKAGHGGRTKS